jgi:transcriptional regulator
MLQWADMYLPPLFAVEDLGQIQDFIDQYSFATVVTQRNGELIASHVPFLLGRGVEPYGVLHAHLAVRNPQLDHFRSGTQALVIFQGPHCYVSPSWYVHPENVPTWNYTAVHAYGVPKIAAPADTAVYLRELVRKHEKAFEHPWDFDPNAPWIQRLLPGIVAFEIKIEKLEGKFKLNQNRTAADRESVIRTLSASSDPAQKAIADLMAENTVLRGGA